LKKILLASLLLLTLAMIIPRSHAWSNGGYSSNPNRPDYGTHDWIAEHALDWIPDEQDAWIRERLQLYLYGTELPDNGGGVGGIGDTAKHHIYYRIDGSLQDDSAAVRAQEAYDQALAYLKAEDASNAATSAGVMSHYIADMAVFGHVMGSATDWGAETHHSDYESRVNAYTESYSENFFTLTFDGSLTNMTAYDAAKDLAYDTTFDLDGDLTCVWMDQHYDWDDSTFRERVNESLNLAVNYVADAVYTLLLAKAAIPTNLKHVVINEVELNPLGDDYEPGAEWVELYNPTSSDVWVGGWTVSSTHGRTVSVMIGMDVSIPPGGHYVVTHITQWLDNEFEIIILKHSGCREIDRVGPFNDKQNDERTWQRYPDGSDHWIFTEPFTKNAVNIPEFPLSALILPIAMVLAIGILRVRLLYDRNRVKMLERRRDDSPVLGMRSMATLNPHAHFETPDCCSKQTDSDEDCRNQRDSGP